MLLLARALLQGGQGVVRGTEEVQGSPGGEPNQVVVGDGRGRCGVIDADVAYAAVAGDAVVGRVHRVVHGDVVLDQVVPGGAFDVYAGRAVVEDGVADQPPPGDVVVVDAVVAVVVGDVEAGQIVVAPRVELEAGVFVVVEDVPGDGVTRTDHVDAVGVSSPALGITAGLVVTHGHP